MAISGTLKSQASVCNICQRSCLNHGTSERELVRGKFLMGISSRHFGLSLTIRGENLLLAKNPSTQDDERVTSSTTATTPGAPEAMWTQ